MLLKFASVTFKLLLNDPLSGRTRSCWRLPRHMEPFRPDTKWLCNSSSGSLTASGTLLVAGPLD